MIDTAKVSDRRALRFESLDDVRRDVEALVAAERAGALRSSGNWTLGQCLGHLAAWIHYSYDGFPLKRPPWFIRWILKARKHSMLNVGLPQGVKIPGVKNGTAGTEPLSTEEGTRQLSVALDRLQRSAPTQDNLMFGPMTHDEWRMLNLRHAELHLAYFCPR